MTSKDSDSIGLKYVDVERQAQAHDTSYLENTVVKSLSWSDVNVVVKDKGAQSPKNLLSGVSGHVAAGEILIGVGLRYLSPYHTAQAK